MVHSAQPMNSFHRNFLHYFVPEPLGAGTLADSRDGQYQGIQSCSRPDFGELEDLNVPFSFTLATIARPSIVVGLNSTINLANNKRSPQSGLVRELRQRDTGSGKRCTEGNSGGRNCDATSFPFLNGNWPLIAPRLRGLFFLTRATPGRKGTRIVSRNQVRYLFPGQLMEFSHYAEVRKHGGHSEGGDEVL